MQKKKKVVVSGEPGITRDQLKQLQEDLRPYSLQWISDLLKRIQADKTVDKSDREAVSTTKIYNVFNGIVSNGRWKLLIYNQGKLLLQDYQSKVQEVVS
jgi:hypothetical protein